MGSFDVLNGNFSIFDHHFIEASAGTGKTFSIEHIIARLLLESDPPITIDQILTVTFTKAATRELKSRVRKTLEKLLTEEESYPYLQNIDPKEKERRIKEALLSYDRANIFTIHGFCHRALKEHAFDADVAFDENSVGINPTELKKNVITDFFRTQLNSALLSPRQIEKVLRRHMGSLRSLVEKLSSDVEKEFEEGGINFREGHALFSSFLKKLPSMEEEKIASDLALHVKNYKGTTKENVVQGIALLPRLLTKRSCSEEEYDALVGKGGAFLSTFLPENRKVRAKEICKADLHYPELLDSLIDLEPIVKEQGSLEALQTRLAQACKKKWETFALEEELFTFDAIIGRMEQGLKSAHFCEKVRKNFRAVIVDEFQDTDAAQWNIFKTLFYPDCPLYLVGDPKQSIYAFRKADLYTYLEAKNTLGEEKSYTLTTNFRSDPSLTQELNRLFDGKWLPLPKVKSFLEVPQVTSPEGREDHPVPKERKRIHFFKGSEEEAYFSYIAHEICTHYKPSDVAILVKDRYQAKNVESYLKSCRIPALTLRLDPLQETLAFSAVQDLLRAVKNPQMGAIKNVLAGPFLSFSIEQLLFEESEEIELVFCEISRLFYEKGLFPFMEAFLQSAFLGTSVFDRASEELLLDARQIVENLSPLSFALPEEYLSEMEEIARKSGEEAPLWQRLPAHGADAVTISTMHMSKGLEYPIVFALGTGERTPAGKIYNPEIDAEKLRQLYVAFTRAKQILYIALPDYKKSPPLGTASPLELFFAEKKAPSYLMEDLYDHMDSLTYPEAEEIARMQKPLYPLTERENPPPKPKITLSPRKQNLYSFSSLAISSSSTIEIPENILPPGSETGTLLHKVMENALKAPGNIEAIVREICSSTHLENWQEEIVSIVEKTLDLPILDFTLRQVETFFQEMEFLYPQTDSISLKGFIDLVFFHKGKYYILDWKTNYLSDYKDETLGKAMREHDYYFQASIYKEALMRYLTLFSDSAPIFGGAIYLFMRGPKALCFMPEEVKERIG